MALPPGPRAPAVLQSYRWTTRPTALADECVTRYGDVFTLRLVGMGPTVLTGHPDGLKEIFTAPPDTLLSGAGNVHLRPILGESSLFVLDGARHGRQRKLMMPPFQSHRLDVYGPLILEATGRACRGWTAGCELSMIQPLQRISLEIILAAVFGLGEKSLAEAMPLFIEAAHTTSMPLMMFPVLQRDLGPGSPGRRWRRAMARTGAVLQAQIDERRSRPDEARTDVLARMMAVRDEDGEGMTDAELRDELVTLLAAGHETTATGLAWALYWLHRLPAVRERLEDELASLDGDADPGAMARLPYLGAVCEEALRIVPVIAMTMRLVAKPFTLMGHDLPVGVRVAACVYLAHQRAETYDSPRAFEPQRFLERKFTPFEFLPYGGGGRRCLGASLASLEMRLVLGTLLRRYRFRLIDDALRPVRRSITLSPRGGPRMRIEAVDQKYRAMRS